MTNAVRVLSGRNDSQYGNRSEGGRAALEVRRAAVLSYEQILAGTASEPRGSHSLAVMPAPLPAPHAQVVRETIAPARTEERAVRSISAEELARDPRAHPISPARPPRAAKPVYVVVEETAQRHQLLMADIEAAGVQRKREAASSEAKAMDALVVEPLEPVAERNGAPPRSVHGSVDVPERSMLSPSQRASLRRPETRLDRNKREAFITYTVDATGKSDGR